MINQLREKGHMEFWFKRQILLSSLITALLQTQKWNVCSFWTFAW